MAPKEAPTAENKENSSNGDSEKVKKALLLRRPSVLYIRDQHPHAVIYMQDRFPDADEHDLIRFLEKNNFNVEKAAQMYQAHLDWRQATLPIPFDTVKDTHWRLANFISWKMLMRWIIQSLCIVYVVIKKHHTI